MSTRTLKKTGFTLVETMMATVIIGIAVTAMLASNVAFTRTNGFGVDLSTAEFLIEEIGAMTATMAVVDPETGVTTFGAEAGETLLADYDDLDDLDGKTYCPPVDVNGSELTSFANFSQVVTVQNVSQSSLTSVVADHSTDFVRVQVDILLNNEQITSTSWIRARY